MTMLYNKIEGAGITPLDVVRAAVSTAKRLLYQPRDSAMLRTCALGACYRTSTAGTTLEVDIITLNDKKLLVGLARPTDYARPRRSSSKNQSHIWIQVDFLVMISELSPHCAAER
jgi:hypothetical protein